MQQSTFTLTREQRDLLADELREDYGLTIDGTEAAERIMGHQDFRGFTEARGVVGFVFCIGCAKGYPWTDGHKNAKAADPDAPADFMLCPHCETRWTNEAQAIPLAATTTYRLIAGEV